MATERKAASITARPVTGGFIVAVTYKVTEPASPFQAQQGNGPFNVTREVTEEHVCAGTQALANLIVDLCAEPVAKAA